MARPISCPSCGRLSSLSAPVGDKAILCPRCNHRFKAKYIGRFQILKELGRGGFGVVYRVFDPKLGREAAVKVLHAEIAASTAGDQSLRRFRNEARLLAQIVHPNIVPLYEADHHEGQLYLVTALIRGQSLDTLIPSGGFSDPRRAVTLVLHLLKTLHHVHTTYGICHRDVKPSNVMVGADDALYLMDFGLAVCREQDSSRITTTGTTLGTPAFMPPEQAEGDLEHIGPPSDQYSAGVVLYYLLTGTVPFRKRMPAILSEIISAPVPPPSSLRPELGPKMDRIILKALAKDPQERYPDCHAFADDLENWSKGYTGGGRGGRRGLSKVWTVLLGMLLTAALLLGGGYFLAQKWQAAPKDTTAPPTHKGEKSVWEGD